MNIATRMARGLVGLFVDDGTLALTLIALLATVSALAQVGAIGKSLAMALLVGGTLGALLVNVTRAAKRSKLRTVADVEIERRGQADPLQHDHAVGRQ
jgi:hypothetical protein